jgi:hypothetical protein
MMNPETKLIIDEITKRFSEHDAKWDLRFSEQESRLVRQIQALEKSQTERVSVLERAAASLEEWRPSIEGTVDTIRLEVKKISRNWECAILDRPAYPVGVLAPTPGASAHATLGMPPTAPPAPPPVIGPRVDISNRESGSGAVSAPIHSPVKGESQLHRPSSPTSVLHHEYYPYHRSGNPGNKSPSMISPNLMVPIPSFGSVTVRIILICMVLSLAFRSG